MTQRARSNTVLAGKEGKKFAPVQVPAGRENAALPRPWVTAHRGSSRVAPENSLPAILQAVSAGADFVEIDLRRSADGVVVLFHDETLARIAGRPQRVEDLPFSELARLDAGAWFSPRFRGLNIPTLSTVLAACRGKISLHLELKGPAFNPAFLADVLELLERETCLRNCVVASGRVADVSALRRLQPALKVGLVLEKPVLDLQAMPLDFVSLRKDAVNPVLVRDLHRRGLDLHVWTVNDPEEMKRFLRMGVDSIITDRPEALVPLRAGMRAGAGNGNTA